MEINLTDEDHADKLQPDNETRTPFLKHSKTLSYGLKGLDSMGEQGKTGRVSTISPRDVTVSNRLSFNTPKTGLGSSHGFNSSDSFELDLEKKNMNRIVLSLSVPDNVFKGNLYSILSCPIITTLILTHLSNRPKFSFLTKPINNSKNFFLRRNPDEEAEDLISDLIGFQNLDTNLKFDLTDSHWNISKTNYKISEDIMTNFIFSLNYELESVNSQLTNIKREFGQRKNIFSKIAMFSLITLVIVVYAIYANLFLDPQFSLAFFFFFLFFGVISIISLAYGLIYGVCAERDEFMEYSILTTIIGKFKTVEDLLHKWNKEVFMQIGVIVTMPSTLNYIHFCLDPYTEIVYDHHELIS